MTRSGTTSVPIRSRDRDNILEQAMIDAHHELTGRFLG